MYETQEILNISVSDLISHVQRLAKEGCRLVNMSCTQEQDHFYIDYAFDLNYRFVALRVQVPMFSDKYSDMPSISGEIFAAFLYENEIHDLFGIEFNGLALDYGGKFYRINAQTPFRTDDTEVITKKD